MDHWHLGDERRAAFRTGWLWAICAIAAVQIALGLAGIVAIELGAPWQPPTEVQTWQRGVEVLLLGGLAAYLLRASDGDARVTHLGALFLLVAVFFAHPPILALADSLPPGPRQAVLIVRAIPVDAFTPAVAWLFVRDFPRALESRRSATVVLVAIAIASGAAIALILVNLAIELRGIAGPLGAFDRNAPLGHYWTVVFGLLLPVLPFSLWRTRHAPSEERRRVRFFAWSIATLSVFPVLLAVLPPWFPSLAAYGELGRRVLIPLNLSLIAAMAATTAYAVVVRRMLDVRTVVRKAAQYWLARLVVALLAGIPYAVLGMELYRARAASLTDLVTDPRSIWLLGLIVLGAGVVVVRRRVMILVDRLFFREPYDSRAVVTAIAAGARGRATVSAWASSLVRQIDAALHVDKIGLLVRAHDGQPFRPVSGAVRHLPSTSDIAQVLSSNGRPLPVELERRGDWAWSIGVEDRTWLADAGAELLVPLFDSDDMITAILTLGPKRSELPFSTEDHLLLEAVAGAAALALETRHLRESSPGRSSTVEQGAAECGACGAVAEAGTPRCPSCGEGVYEGILPRDLFGKFRVEKRIGQGGMGVVYLATDLELGRSVALKTLPETSPEDVAQLRREARAMAAITHPNLALILGAETWRGTPVLVLEYLAGGTLADRIAKGPMPLSEALRLAARIARGLDRAHAAGILHRDVKPSNIGFADDGVPKLLDFGLARIARGTAAATPGSFADAVTETGIAGTPLYMSPEALRGERPIAEFDLWSLSAVTFEAMAGVHPFERETSASTFAAIQAGWSDRLRTRLPGCPDRVAAFFANALSAEVGVRPATAAAMAAQLDRLLPHEELRIDTRRDAP